MTDLNSELDALREQSATVLESEGPRSCQIAFTENLAKRIAENYAEGKSLAAISRLAEMPAYSTLLRWVKENSVLRAALEGVRQVRALHFEDRALEVCEEATGKDADRLKFEGNKWAAEVNDPARYGKKVTHSGDASNPITIQVITGFGEPNEFQRPPKLGADGLIEKPVIEIKAEVADVVRKDESSDSGNSDETTTPEVV